MTFFCITWTSSNKCYCNVSIEAKTTHSLTLGFVTRIIILTALKKNWIDSQTELINKFCRQICWKLENFDNYLEVISGLKWIFNRTLPLVQVDNKRSGLNRTRDGNGTCACSIKHQDERMTRHFIIFVTLTMLLHLLRILDIYLFPLIEYKLFSLIWWWAVNEVLIRTEIYTLSSALLSYKMRVIVSSKIDSY